jgi:hypothetical protein
MSEVTADLPKSCRDRGTERCNIGVGMQNRDKPERDRPMIAEFSRLIPAL